MGRVYADIRVTALCDEDMNDFLFLLRKIRECSLRGMSRTIEVNVDGDGSGQYSFTVLNPEGEDRAIEDFVHIDPAELKLVEYSGNNNFTVSLGE